MAEWVLVVAVVGIGSMTLHFVEKIFREVRSIRVMMNADRRISNEVVDYDDA